MNGISVIFTAQLMLPIRYTVLYNVYNAHCSLYMVHVVYIVVIIYSVQCTAVHYTLCIQCALYTVYSVHYIQCTVYTVQCTVYIYVSVHLYVYVWDQQCGWM